jgi:integrase
MDRRHPSPQQLANALQHLAEALRLLGVDLAGAAGRLLLTPRRRAGRKKRAARGPTVASICRRYMTFAAGYYPPNNRGGTGSETTNIELALRLARRLYGRSRIADFGPLKLKRVRDAMVEAGWCRKHVNQQVGRVKRMFRWATENELIPPSVYHGLQPVAGLRAGRTPAPDRPPVKPAPAELVEGSLAFMTPTVRAMVKLQMLTGMRPGEMLMLRTCDVDRSQTPWRYSPARHKTEHHGHARVVYLGPQAQAVLGPLLRPHSPEDFVFSPAEADRERRAALTAARKTPLSCGNRPGTNRRRRPRKQPGVKYDTCAYRRAITYACDRAFPPPGGLDAASAAAWRREHRWHPHQLRHSVATRLRQEFGLDAAQAVLGHKTLQVTQVYAEKHERAAADAMTKIG